MSTSPAIPAWKSYVELARPANVVTALGDVLAGFAVAGLGNPEVLPALLLATSCLYAAGVTFNDVCDRTIDAHERPERPIPSGRVTVRGAMVAVFVLFLTGLAASAVVSADAILVALALVVAVVLYDMWGKHRPVVGPLNMGLCRGLNLCLGMTAVRGTIDGHAWLGVVPLTYIAAVTLLSRGEVLGGVRATATLGLAAVAGVVGALTLLSLGAAAAGGSVAGGLLLTIALGWRVLPAFGAARRDPSAPVIRRAVRTGVLSLVLLDGVIAAVYAGMIYGLALVVLALLAGRLARAFAVT